MGSFETYEEETAFRAAQSTFWRDPERSGLTLEAFRLGWIASRTYHRRMDDGAREIPQPPRSDGAMSL